MRARILILGVAVILLVAACSNSSSSGKSTSTIPNAGGTTPTSFGDLTQNVAVKANGVTDKEIRTNAVITLTNSPVGSYGPLADGIRAYFAMVNDGGGIYGRQLKLTKVYDDLLGANAQAVKTALAEKTFATFGATSLFTGADALARANQPTFMWNINPQFAGHNNMFANIGAICFKCPSHFLPFIAKQLGATKIGVLAYGVAQESKECAEGAKASFEQFYPTAKVVFLDNSLPFAANVSAQVTQMKNKGVTLVGTCFDFGESYTLGKEMQRQGLKAVQVQPNGYDAAFLAKNAAALEGSIVFTQFVAFEKQPQFSEVAKLMEWAQKTNVPVKELTAYGWVLADEFVTGLKLAGPNFSQQKVIDGLNSLTAYDDNGFIPPIDWTKAHNDPQKDPSSLSKLDCQSYVKAQGGKFVAVYDQPGKPWVCFDRSDPNVDNPQYTNFAPS